MPRDIPVGNGNLLVAFDKDYRIRDLYYPYVGEENHTKGDPCRFGIWADGEFLWVEDILDKELKYAEDTLVTNVKLHSKKLGLEFVCNDFVDFEDNIYVKRVFVRNLLKRKREVKLFFHHDLHISESELGHTAYFDPKSNSLIHYKGKRYFAISTCCHDRARIDQFAVGMKEVEDMEGTWRDAEDGLLSGNPIAQGKVDSTIGINLKLPAYGEEEVCYWIAVGKDYEEVLRLSRFILKLTPEMLLKRTSNYWSGWVSKEDTDFSPLPKEIVRLFKRSLLIIRTQIDNRGAIIAANDTDIAHFNRDTYSYMWPRDGALVSYALDKAGYEEISRRFFVFCNNVMLEEGYLLHKYNPDGSLGSSWHPWIHGGTPQLPIQEDETALVLWALWNHYEMYRDIEFIKPLYSSLVIKAADFMDEYRSEKTGLPFPSYDLWEERRGVLAFTCSAVYAGLVAASNFCKIFNDLEMAERFLNVSLEVRKGIEKHLFMEVEGRFARMANFKGDDKEVDSVIDSSLFGLFKFGVFPADDKRIENTMKAVEERLTVKTDIGGVARYEDDYYHQVSKDVKNIPGNPWFICTIWLAQYYIEKAHTIQGLSKALPFLNWVAEHALLSGVFPEQVDPHTGNPLSVSPLTWSHAAFVMSVLEYLEKFEAIDVCPSCGNSRFKVKRNVHCECKKD